MSKVSICIPCYNNADEVKRLLNSIKIQKYTDYEVIISDDSTNLETSTVLEEYEDVFYIVRLKQEKEIPKTSANKPVLRYQHNERPYGHILNWNVPIRMATGAYIKIMFSDDWFTEEDSLGEWVKMLDENPEAMLAFSGSRQVMLDGVQLENMKHLTQEQQIQLKKNLAENKQPYYDRHAENNFLEQLQKDYRTLFLGNQIGAPSAVIYRRGANLTLFDEKSNWASDMYLFFDLLQKSSQFVFTEKPLVSIGVHEHQYTEMFAEKDMRIYNDYRYMYEKYELYKSKVCRQYFLETFIIKYKTGMKEAVALGNTSADYWKAWIAEQRESVRCFMKYHFGIGKRDK